MSLHPATITSDTRSEIKYLFLDRDDKSFSHLNRRALLNKVDYFSKSSGIVNKLTNGISSYVIGNGISANPVSSDKEFNKRIKEAWEEWSADPQRFDIAKKNNLHEKQQKIISDLIKNGEAFECFKSMDGITTSTQTINNLAIESAYFDTDNEQELVDGVKIDKYGAPIAYHLLQDDGQSEMIAANSIAHIFDPKKSNKTRGITHFQSTINTIHDVLDILSLVKQNVKQSAAMSLHIKSKDKNLNSLKDQLIASAAAANGETTEKPKPQLDGANIIDGEDIEDVKQINGKNPSTEVMKFIEHHLREICAGVGFNYEFIWNVEKVGGAPSRFILADANRQIENLQNIIISRYLQPLFTWYTAHQQNLYIESNGILGIEPCETDDWQRCEWLKPEKITTDLGKDFKMFNEAINNGLMTEEAYLKMQNVDRTAHVKTRVSELKQVIEECREQDVPIDFYYRQSAPEAAPEAAPAPQEQTATTQAPQPNQN